MRSDGAQPEVGAQDPHHLGGGAVRVLPLERRGQLQDLGRGPRGHLPLRRHQRGEPAPAPRPDPPVQTLPRHLNLVPERAFMDSVGHRPDQPAPRTRRQRRVGSVTDQLVAPVRHLLRTLAPARPAHRPTHIISSTARQQTLPSVEAFRSPHGCPGPTRVARLTGPARGQQPAHADHSSPPASPTRRARRNGGQPLTRRPRAPRPHRPAPSAPRPAAPRRPRA